MCEQAVSLAHLVVSGSSEHPDLSMCIRGREVAVKLLF